MAAMDNVTDLRAWARARSRRRHPSTWAEHTTPVHIADRSPDALWRSDFEVHADQHAAATTSGMWVLAPVVERALRKSLPVFQLGEIGTGSHLHDAAQGVVSDDLLQALRLFVVEEQEHARIQALVCTALDIDMLDDHWTERVFRSARRLRGYRLEMLLVLIAEFITAQVYETIAEGVGDPALSRLFARMHADELRHLEFHASTFPTHLGTLRKAILAPTRVAWLIVAHVAAVVVAIEHRALLRACGSSVRRFVIDTTKLIRANESRFF